MNIVSVVLPHEEVTSFFHFFFIFVINLIPVVFSLVKLFKKFRNSLFESNCDIVELNF